MVRSDGALRLLLNALLDELLELDGAAREERLAQVARENESLATQAANLLARQNIIEKIGFLETPPALPGNSIEAGRRIGGYRLGDVISLVSDMQVRSQK